MMARGVVRGLWFWLNRVLGIWGKVIVMWVLLVVMVGSWIAWRSDHITTGALTNMLESRGISVAQDLATRSADLVFTNDLYDLHEMLIHTMEHHHELVYLFILNTAGEVLVYSYPAPSVPQELVSFHSVSGDQEHSQASFESEAGIIHDVAVPIAGGLAGTVRLGIGEAGLREVAAQMLTSLNYAIIFAFLVGVVITAMLSEMLLSPLRQLTEATKAVAAGDFAVRVPAHVPDEIGQLAEAFNQMTEKLRDYQQQSSSSRAELERKERLRIELVKRLIAAQEEERKRISRELHDETSQSLSALKLGLKAIEEASSPADVRELTQELRGILAATMAEVSTLSRELRPSVLDDMGLGAALERYVQNCSAWLGKPITFSSKGLNSQRFPFYLETAVYRIVQEALTNVRKYARAGRIQVELYYENRTLMVTIADDGVGFSPDKVMSGKEPHGGLGLFGMQERALLIGGTLEVISAPGKGTVILLTVPMGNSGN